MLHQQRQYFSGDSTSKTETHPKKPALSVLSSRTELHDIHRAQQDDYSQNDRLEIQDAMVKPQQSMFQQIQHVFNRLGLGTRIIRRISESF